MSWSSHLHCYYIVHLHLIVHHCNSRNVAKHFIHIPVTGDIKLSPFLLNPPYTVMMEVQTVQCLVRSNFTYKPHRIYGKTLKFRLKEALTEGLQTSYGIKGLCRQAFGHIRPVLHSHTCLEDFKKCVKWLKEANCMSNVPAGEFWMISEASQTDAIIKACP